LLKRRPSLPISDDLHLENSIESESGIVDDCITSSDTIYRCNSFDRQIGVNVLANHRATSFD